MRPARPLLLAVALTVPCTAAAQDTYDRGIFVIRHGNAEVGREEFSIRASTSRGAQAFLAVSTIRIGGREVQRALEVSRDYLPLSLQQTESSGGRVVSRISAQLSGIRFSARVATQEGETAREFPVRPPVAILGDDAYSSFYFVPHPDAGSRDLAVIRPGEPRAQPATVTAGGADTVEVGGRQVPALRYLLKVGAEERQFWFSPAGDLLQVRDPGKDLLATRLELPQH